MKKATIKKWKSSRRLSVLARVSKKKGEGAFTLVELLIVLSLICLVLGLALPFFESSLPNARLQEAAREAAAMMRYAREQAQADNRDQAFILDMDAGRYGIEGKMGRPIPPGVRVKVIDPFLGEVHKGRYTMLFPSTGGAEGGTIVISNEKKELSIMSDPIIGSIVVKNENGQK